MQDAIGEPRPQAMVFSLKSDPALSSKARRADDRFWVPTMRALALRALLHALHLAMNLIWPFMCDQPHSGSDNLAKAPIPQPERARAVLFWVTVRPRFSELDCRSGGQWGVRFGSRSGAIPVPSPLLSSQCFTRCRCQRCGRQRRQNRG